MTRMNYVFILLLIFLNISTKLYSQTCTGSGFPTVPAMATCASAASSISSGANINGGGSFSYCGTGTPSYSSVNLSGGSIYICGNVTITSGTFNSGKIFVACGATLTFTNDVTLNSNVGIVNHGRVQFNSNLTFQNGDNFFYNEGYSSRLNVNGNLTMPGNAGNGYIRNSGRIVVGGILNLGGGGKICGSAGSVISTVHFFYGSNNCNPNDIFNNRLMFNGTASQKAILHYSGTAQLAGDVTSSASWNIYCAGSNFSLICQSRPSSWGSATVFTNASPIPTLPATVSQAGCLVNGAVSCNSIVALPVELLYFRSDCTENKVQLNWATGSERNNDYWTIERSEDLVNTEVIGKIAGEGNSSQVTKYTFEDENALGKPAYYRITQHDYDGKSESFDWISINCGLAGKFNVFPNPSAGTFKITTSLSLENPVTFHVLDCNGKVILQGNKELTSGIPAELNFEGFSSGVYYLKIESASESWTSKLIKL